MVINGVARAAAVPTATLNVPSEGFVGEQLSFTVTFDNTAAGTTETGYGPYINLLLPATGVDGTGAATDDGVTFVSATYLGQAVTATVLTSASSHITDNIKIALPQSRMEIPNAFV